MKSPPQRSDCPTSPDRSVRSGRNAARTPDRVVRVALLVAVAMHVLLALALREAMRQTPSDEQAGLLVRILDAVPAEAQLPEPPPPDRSAPAPEAKPLVAPVRSSQPAAGHTTAMPTASPTRPATSPMHWFNADGAVRLAPAVKPTLHEADMERARELLARGHYVLRCSHSRLDPRPTAEEEGNEAIKSTRLLGFMFQRPWDIQAQHDAQVETDISAASDLTIAERKIADQACDDASIVGPGRSRYRPAERHLATGHCRKKAGGHEPARRLTYFVVVVMACRRSRRSVG